MGLEDREAFAALLRADRVSAVLCGHFHQQIAGVVNGVPVWVTPGVFTRIDHLSGRPGTERAVADCAASVVDVTDLTSPRFAVLPASDHNPARVAYEATAQELAKDLGKFGLPVIADR